MSLKRGREEEGNGSDAANASLAALLIAQVRAVLNKQPSTEALYDLLRIATPELNLEDVRNEEQRASAWKKLQARIHPDKHLGGTQDASTGAFQDAKNFFDQCVKMLGIGVKLGAKATVSMASGDASNRFPATFHTMEKWAHTEYGSSLDSVLDTRAHGDRFAAAACVNIRGSIVHGKKIELAWDTSFVEGDTASFGGGFIRLETERAIKEQLQLKGPVVSENFVLRHDFVRRGSYADSFDLSQFEDGKTLPVLIVGWEMTMTGEAWIVRGPHAPHYDVKIARGQFGIEESVLAPKSSFENQAWQPGPYLKWNFDLHSDWKQWPASGGTVSWTDLKKLLVELKMDGSSILSIVGKECTVQDVHVAASSRRAKITDLLLVDKLEAAGDKCFNLSVSFVD
mmetsp:Transcript_24826/g.59059  ORF Transcript_24826/g.59059 Transcript_24826/m.59059 type:complete len:398 (-) Transcript_24826:70-1263(-)